MNDRSRYGNEYRYDVSRDRSMDERDRDRYPSRQQPRGYEDRPYDIPPRKPERRSNPGYSTGRPANRNERSGSASPLRIISGVLLTALVIGSAFLTTSGARLIDASPTQSKSLASDIDNMSADIRAQALTDSGIYAMKRTKIIPWSEDPCPLPNSDAFQVTNGESDQRAESWSYEDETIKVTGWTEHIEGCKVYFSDVTIAHPSQLRTALANGSFPSSAYPSDMARSVNAVIACNGDFSGYRESGMIIRQGVCLRSKQYDKLTWDVLMIDDQGDFHISDDRHIDVEQFKQCKYSANGKTYNIVNTLHFGPSLVVDGKRNIMHMQSGCGNEVNETYKRSHTAIGQLGKLHYLICSVEETDSGMKPASLGTNINVMADIMASKNCIQAYNLDGGQSTTLVFGGNTLNFVNRGGERELSEIVYFASADNVE